MSNHIVNLEALGFTPSVNRWKLDWLPRQRRKFLPPERPCFTVFDERTFATDAHGVDWVAQGQIDLSHLNFVRQVIN